MVALTGVASAALALACQKPSSAGDPPVAVSADSASSPGNATGPGALARPQPPAPGSAPAAPAPPCLPLPAARPADWSARFARTTLPVRKPISREAVTLAASCDGQPAPCVTVAPADLDALYASFLRLGFSASWEVNPGDHRSPHYGSRELITRWAGSECRVHDGRGTRVDPAHEAHFNELTDAVLARSKR